MFQCSTDKMGGEDYCFLSVLLCDTAHVTNNEIHNGNIHSILQGSTGRHYVKKKVHIELANTVLNQAYCARICIGKL